MLQSMKPENPLVVRARQELTELRRKYDDLQIGSGDRQQEEIFMPVARVPEVGIQMAELMREAKVQETVWQLLNSQYYQTRIEEARDTPTVQVLDAAVPPLFKSSPKRKMLAVVLGLLAGIATIFYAFKQEYAGRLDQRPAEKARWQEFFGALRSDRENITTWLRKRRR